MTRIGFIGGCLLAASISQSVFAQTPPEIELTIRRAGEVAFNGKTSLSMMARTPEELVDWLGRENDFPYGVMLLTGTGIVPPDAFTLSTGDIVDIAITGIGTLNNPVG